MTNKEKKKLQKMLTTLDTTVQDFFRKNPKLRNISFHVCEDCAFVTEELIPAWKYILYTEHSQLGK